MDESFINVYLEKRGFKYIVPLSALSYLLGTIIFNTYFYNLGITEFDLLKLRYMLVGVVFVVFTASIGALFYGIKARIFPTATIDKKNIKSHLVELILLLVMIPWTIVYSLYVFPLIPSAFGGAKPLLVRLIGETATIKELNEMIAFETGIDVATLPLEKLGENSDLSVGSNVKILDRNSSRVVLVLTKDLYLSTTSSVAKKLLDSGAVKTFDDDDYESDFTTKPIIFSAENIRGTTTTLYQPSNVTTQADLEVVTRVLTESPDKASNVQAAITDDLKELAPKLVQAVQKKVAEKKSAPTTNQSESEKTDQLIKELVQEAVDTKFITFRGEIFRIINLAYIQQKTGDRSLASRQRVAKKFADFFTAQYPVIWGDFSGNDNFLILGQGSDDYFLRLQRIVQGASTAEMIMERLNAVVVQTGPDFDQIQAGVLELITKSSAENSVTNRKYVSEIIQKYLRQKAPQMTIYWLDTMYLVQGSTSEKFLVDVQTVFRDAKSWEDLSTRLSTQLLKMKSDVETPTEEPVAIDTTDDTTTEEPTEEPTEPTAETTKTTETSEPETTVAPETKKSAPTEETTTESTTVENNPETTDQSETIEETTPTDETTPTEPQTTTEPEPDTQTSTSEEPVATETNETTPTDSDAEKNSAASEEVMIEEETPAQSTE